MAVVHGNVQGDREQAPRGCSGHNEHIFRMKPDSLTSVCRLRSISPVRHRYRLPSGTGCSSSLRSTPEHFTVLILWPPHSGGFFMFRMYGMPRASWMRRSGNIFFVCRNRISHFCDVAISPLFPHELSRAGQWSIPAFVVCVGTLGCARNARFRGQEVPLASAQG